MIQVPKNKIVENQYTNGTGIGKNISLRFVKSKIPYIGFYSIINGNKYFSGKTYTEDSRPLEKYNLLGAAALAASALAKGSLPTKAGSIFSTKGNEIRYFYKDLTNPNILIKEIDLKAYNELAAKSASDYQVILYNPNITTLDEANQQMPGLREFLVT
jgi:hypothetical protein